MRVVLLGPPGSGKGTQAALLSKRLGITSLSTGELLRRMLKSPHCSPEVRAIESGSMVSDTLANNLVSGALANVGSGFCLDGYPRTLGQMEYLDSYGAQNGWCIDVAVHLSVDRGEIERRIKGRGRTDDDAGSLDRRLALYESQTVPVVTAYEVRGLLTTVCGEGGVDEVHRRICESLAVHV